jgi:hypothetical protein
VIYPYISIVDVEHIANCYVTKVVTHDMSDCLASYEKNSKNKKMKICHVGLMSSGRMSCSSAAPIQSKKKPAAPSGLVIAFPYKVLWNVENFSVFYVLFIKLNCFYKILL